MSWTEPVEAILTKDTRDDSGPALDVNARIGRALDTDPDRSRTLSGLRQACVLGRIRRNEYAARLSAQLNKWEREDRA